MGFAAGAQGLIIEGRPGRGASTEVGPEMESGPQRLVAVPPDGASVKGRDERVHRFFRSTQMGILFRALILEDVFRAVASIAPEGRRR